MYRLFDLDTLATFTVDSLDAVAIALHGRQPGDFLVDVLDELDGALVYLPLIELDIQFAVERDALLPHVVDA